jgi:hypothetical protein
MKRRMAFYNGVERPAFFFTFIASFHTLPHQFPGAAGLPQERIPAAGYKRRQITLHS